MSSSPYVQTADTWISEMSDAALAEEIANEELYLAELRAEHRNRPGISVARSLREGSRSAQIYAYIVKVGGCGPREIATECRIPISTAEHYVGYMVEAGLLQRFGHGKYDLAIPSEAPKK